MSARMPDPDVAEATKPITQPSGPSVAEATTDSAPDPTEASTPSIVESPPPRNRRRLAVVAGVLVVVCAGAAALAIADPWGEDAEDAPSTTSSDVNLATVKEGAVRSQINQGGTLSYAAAADGSDLRALNQASGVYTRLPQAGDTVECGEELYRVESKPVILLCADAPAYRDLQIGDKGWDVRQLNRNLVELGYADKDDLDPESRTFSWETHEALEELQDEVNAEETGELRLGDALFLDGPLRVSKTLAELGARAGPGAPVLSATTTEREVTVPLSASQQAAVKVGDKAQIVLPNNRTTTGKVSRIGTVAQSSSEQEEDASATVPVYVTLDEPKDAGTLDEAPVQVFITSDGVEKALSVPVTALLGHAGGGYAVERVDQAGRHETVPVKVGLFDNANGVVQVTGSLAAGDRVVVPRT
ncbi:peptidoglycan-binding protein [Kineosporia sp. NBRC 101677]|uniref:efflux RND transporter periplasmic adaptor subunit n=1 Tax=Kineosporia sp. NBRC 101677 TaxID=3032197 RepID=UPI0024A43CCB|nr:hypothetical protein [Kineosporia sp. NBRC 101677]GLY15827.1 peptidoglycan-binding protein [Kineosporia sp. NBRC 101677]